MRENKIEAYLKQQVKARGGETRKFVSPGHVGVPDQIIIWAGEEGATIHFVEVKATGKSARLGSAQAREHVRLQKLGCVVLVLNSIEAVDNYMKNYWAVYRKLRGFRAPV